MATVSLPGAECFQIDMRERLIQCLDVAAFVEDEPRRGGVGKIPDEIPPADFVVTEIEGRRRLVHQPLDRQCDDRPRHAAIGRHGAGISGDGARRAGIGAHIIGSGQLGHGHERLDPAGGRKARIGADIGGEVGRQRDQSAKLVERAFERQMLVAAVIGGDQIFPPVFVPGHR